MVDLYRLPLPREGESSFHYLNRHTQSAGAHTIVAHLKMAEDMCPDIKKHTVKQIRYKKVVLCGQIKYTDLLKSEKSYFEDMVLRRIRDDISQKEMDGFIPLTLEWSDEGRDFYMQGTFRWKISGWVEDKPPEPPPAPPEPVVTFEKPGQVTFRKVK